MLEQPCNKSDNINKVVENTKKNHKRVVSLCVIEIPLDLHKL